ncbi:MAG: hypothetical protein HY924_12945 [Elusimicrobia bacterium]|nr:hypothetical protein [Elusimicrobiota bacterium]
MNIMLAAAVLALNLVCVRMASADEGRWAQAMAAAAGAAALPGSFDGIRIPGGAAPMLPLPRLPVFRAAPPAGTVPTEVAFNGITLPRSAFTSRESLSGHLVRAIDAAKGSLKLLLYDLSLEDVAAALQRAASRSPSVEIMVVLDQGHVFPRRGRKANAVITRLLADPRIQARIVAGLGDFGLMHNKIAVFDGVLVKTGSFNWTKSAEKSNYENAVFFDDAERVAAFSAYFDWVWALSGPPDAPRPPPTVEGAPPEDASPGVEFHGARLPAAAFSPKGGTAGRLLDAIAISRESIDVAMFSFTSKTLAEALAERKAAGVRVRVVLDRKQSRNANSVLAYLRSRGVDVAVMDGKTKAGVQHSKYAVFDGAVVETGSYNWTVNGESYSFENAAFLSDPGCVAGFQADFETLWSLGRKELPASLAASDGPQEDPSEGAGTD